MNEKSTKRCLLALKMNVFYYAAYSIVILVFNVCTDSFWEVLCSFVIRVQPRIAGFSLQSVSSSSRKFRSIFCFALFCNATRGEDTEINQTKMKNYFQNNFSGEKERMQLIIRQLSSFSCFNGHLIQYLLFPWTENVSYFWQMLQYHLNYT